MGEPRFTMPWHGIPRGELRPATVGPPQRARLPDRHPVHFWTIHTLLSHACDVIGEVVAAAIPGGGTGA